MTDIFERLAAPFPPEAVSWRVGTVKKDGSGAMALAYIDARDVMDRFDEVCGPGGWQNRYSHAEKKTVCEVGIKIDGEWVWKADGAGDSDIEAEKGSLSDAFKRAAVRWGVGRYLYHLPTPWVQIDQYKKITPESLSKLEGLLRGKGAPAKPAQIKPEETGLYGACKAAMDLANDEETLAHWAEDNKASMQKMHDEYPEVHAAVRRYYGAKLQAFRQKVAA